MTDYLNVHDLRRAARRKLPRPVFDYLDGGSEDELTLRRNADAFSDVLLLPRACQPAGRIDSRTNLLGADLEWPFVVGPAGMPGLFDIGGELALARAAEKSGALYSLSTMSTRSIEEVAIATKAPKAFQLYLFRDRAVSLDLIHRAQAAGYAALILTVDVQVPANRERDRRAGMVLPPRFSARTIAEFVARPRWCWDQLVRRPIRMANFTGLRASPGTSLLSYIGEQLDPDISWKDVEWVASHWRGPLAVKGIMRAEDAELALGCGASAVILSNHGGRQLDGAAAPLDMLEDVVEQLAGRAEVILDGGVRRGTDMIKALALGAKGCMSARVPLYGLAAAGEYGAEVALQILRTELNRDQALLGTPAIAQIDASFIKRIHRPDGVGPMTIALSNTVEAAERARHGPA